MELSAPLDPLQDFLIVDMFTYVCMGFLLVIEIPLTFLTHSSMWTDFIIVVVSAGQK